jgi:hypothetical protein
MRNRAILSFMEPYVLEKNNSLHNGNIHITVYAGTMAPAYHDPYCIAIAAFRLLALCIIKVLL